MTLQMLRSPLKPYQLSGGLWFDGSGDIRWTDSSLKTASGTLILRLKSLETEQATIFMSGFHYLNNQGVLLQHDLSMSVIRGWVGDGTSFVNPTFDIDLLDDGLTHTIALTWSLTATDLYLDNIQMDSKSISNPVSYNSSRFISLSSEYGFNYYKSIMYEAILIAEALSQSEIRGLMDGRRLPTEWDCRLWLDFRQGHIRDLSGKGNHGKIYGGAYLMPPVTPMAHAIGGLAE